MKVFFIGSVLFSREMLIELIKNPDAEIVGIATKSRSDFNSDHSDLSDLAKEHNIPFKYVKDINSSPIINWISSLKPDIIFCLGWSSLIKKELLELTQHGVIGYHPAELPYNRGRHPIIWALVLGLDRTASTFFRMDEGADTGDIIDQKIIDISIDDNSATLYKKLTDAAKLQLNDILHKYSKNTIKYIKQNPDVGNTWRKRTFEDGEIDWRMRSIDIYNLVRALYKPYPGAHMKCADKIYKVWKCEIVEFPGYKNIEPGKVLKVEGNQITVKTGDGAVKLTDHELENIQVNTYIL